MEFGSIPGIKTLYLKNLYVAIPQIVGLTGLGRLEGSVGQNILNLLNLLNLSGPGVDAKPTSLLSACTALRRL